MKSDKQVEAAAQGEVDVDIISPGTDGRRPSDASVATNLQLLGCGDDVKARARSQVFDSFAFVPDEEKAAFLKAMQRVPDLVELESNPDHHLHYTGFDPWKTALRLAKYWKTRVDIFGEERAFLPMTITGDGAMSQEDIEVLNTGALIVLPEDDEGRAVLFHDRSRLTSREFLDGAKRMRCLFYMLSTMAESEKSRRLGYVMLSVYTEKTRNQTIDGRLSKDGAALVMHEVFPLRPLAYHTVLQSKRPLLKKVVPMMFKILEKLNLVDRIAFEVHSCESPERQLQELTQKYGFSLEGIPKVPLGGLFTIGCFRQWLEDRHRRDAQVYGSSSNAAQLVPPDVSLEDERVRKRREAEAASARRKRARKQNEIKEMQEEAECLRSQNQALREVNNNLEQLVRQAHEMVELYERQTQEHLMMKRPAVNALIRDHPSDTPFIPQAALQTSRLHDSHCTAAVPRPGPTSLEHQQPETRRQLQLADMEPSRSTSNFSFINNNMLSTDQPLDALSLQHQAAEPAHPYDALQHRANMHELAQHLMPSTLNRSAITQPNELVAASENSEAPFLLHPSVPLLQHLQNVMVPHENLTPLEGSSHHHEARLALQQVTDTRMVSNHDDRHRQHTTSLSTSFGLFSDSSRALDNSTRFNNAQQQNLSHPILHNVSEVLEPTPYSVLALNQQQQQQQQQPLPTQAYNMAGVATAHIPEPLPYQAATMMFAATQGGLLATDDSLNNIHSSPPTEQQRQPQQHPDEERRFFRQLYEFLSGSNS